MAFGNSSRISSSRFGAKARPAKLTPVTLPSGRFRLVTRPVCTGSAPDVKTMGIVAVAALAARTARAPAARNQHRHLTANQIGRQLRQPVVLAGRPTVFDRHILTRNKAGFVEALAECDGLVGIAVERPGVEESDHRLRRLLRGRSDRPRCCGAPEERDEFAPLHPAMLAGSDYAVLACVLYLFPKKGVHARLRRAMRGEGAHRRCRSASAFNRQGSCSSRLPNSREATP